VEGAELSVLDGLVKTIEKFRPFLYIEVWANSKDSASVDRITQIYNLITSRDYSIIGVSRDRKLEVIKSSDKIFEQDDPNYMSVPNELVEVFKTNVGMIDDSNVSV